MTDTDISAALDKLIREIDAINASVTNLRRRKQIRRLANNLDDALDEFIEGLTPELRQYPIDL